MRETVFGVFGTKFIWYATITKNSRRTVKRQFWASASDRVRVRIGLAFVALIGSIIVLFAVSIWLAPLRHVTVYRDKTKQEALLRVLQAWKWGMIARHTVTDAFGEVLARVRTNRLRNFLVLKEWRCYAPDDSLLCIVKEESAVTWLLRQLGSWLFLVAKTNFILCHGVPEKVIGRFNRNIEILNRYSLDLSADSEKTMDRRIAVAIGVIIDMDEKPWVA
jgi:hypothetical protein